MVEDNELLGVVVVVEARAVLEGAFAVPGWAPARSDGSKPARLNASAIAWAVGVSVLLLRSSLGDMTESSSTCSTATPKVEAIHSTMRRLAISSSG